MDLQEPSASTILVRRGTPRPTLKRNDSSFSVAISRADADQDVDITKVLQLVTLDPSQKDTVKKDLKLVSELKSEQVLQTPSVEKIALLTTPNKYKSWQCSFDMKLPAYTPSAIPSKPKDFLEAVNSELKTIVFIKGGLSKYVQLISSGEHHVFSSAFLKRQNEATNITLSQLDQITEHLNKIVTDVETKLEEEKEEIEDEDSVQLDLQEAFGYAKLWIARIRAVLVNSHVFYKINYALAADKKMEQT